MKRLKSPTVGDLVFSNTHGPGIVTEHFRIRKAHPKMLTVLFGSKALHVYEADVAVLQRVERRDDGSVAVVFDRRSS